MTRLPFGLLAITPPTGPVDPDRVAQWVQAAGSVGVALLLREVAAPAQALRADGRLGAVATRARALSVPVLWSADAHTVRGAGAQGLAADLSKVDGVQLRGDPGAADVDAVRAHLGSRLLGRSVHGTPQPGAVDFSVFAPVFDPRTTTPMRPPKKAAGLPALQAWTRAVPRVFALGGVDRHNASACVVAGPWGVASIAAFFGTPDVVHAEVAALAAAVGARPGV